MPPMHKNSQTCNLSNYPQLTVPVLIAALADGNFHSGEALGQKFGVSKTTIRKKIQALQEFALEVHSLQGKGYRLAEPLQLLNIDTIKTVLCEEQAKKIRAIDYTLSTDSTNLQAVRALLGSKHSLAPGEAQVFFSEHQTSGKGRRGRTWISPFGHNLYCSVLYAVPKGAAALAGISLVVALALHKAIARLGCHGLKVKWPNDVYFDGRKLAGILLEMHGDVSGPCHLVIGIGVNLSSRQPAMQNIDQAWTALDTVGYSPVMRNKFAGLLLEELLVSLQEYERAGFASFVQRWAVVDDLLGKQVILSNNAERIDGICRGVGINGELLLELSSGVTQAFVGGELSIRLNQVEKAALSEQESI